MDLIKPTLILAVIITLIMLIINGLIIISEKDIRYKHTFEFWLTYLVYFIYEVLSHDASPEIIALVTVIWIWRTRTIVRILSDVSGANLAKSWHTGLFLGAYTFSFMMAILGREFAFFTVPVAFANFAICIDVINRTRLKLKANKEYKVPHVLLLLNILVIGMHFLDYPFLRFVPEFAVYAYMVVLINVIVMAVVLPSVTILDLEREHKNKLEDTLSMRMRQLEEKSRLSTLGQMTTGIFPQFNDPLSIISSRTTELRHKVYNNEMEKETLIKSLNQIEETSERMTRVIHSLKKFGRDSRTAPFEMVPIATIVEDTLSYCVDRFQHAGILLDVEPYPVKSIECRSSQISQVILNLLVNSFEAVQETRYAWTRISFEEGATTIRLRVTDSGNGIQEQVRIRMMEPFFTTKLTSGTGLGLSIARRITEEHHGKIFYDDTSINTSFVVELPYRQSSI